MTRNIHGCFFFTAQSGEGEERKKKKGKNKLKKQGIFFVSITVDKCEIQRSPAQQKDGDDRWQPPPAAGKRQSTFPHNGDLLPNTYQAGAGGEGAPRPAGEEPPARGRRWGGGGGGEKEPTPGFGEGSAGLRTGRGARAALTSPLVMLMAK